MLPTPTFRPLAPDAVPEAVALSDAVGWDVGPADWRLFHDLEGATPLGGRVDGDLVATATVVRYPPDAAWLGMVLVDPDHRRRGYGTAAYRTALGLARADATRIGLDANDAGYPLYVDEFVDAAVVEEWRADPAVDSRATATATTDPSPAALVALDRATVDVDRGELVAALVAADATVPLAVGPPGDPRAYALMRPAGGTWTVGPLVAPDRPALDALLDATATVADGEVVVDVPDPASETRAALRDHGFARSRTLTRMTLDGAPILVGDAVRGVAGLALG